MLGIGEKIGCITIISGIEAYQEEVMAERIKRLEQDKQRFINGENVTSNNFDSLEQYDNWIKQYKSIEKYKCKCKCGKIDFYSEKFFYSADGKRKRPRYCSEECGLKEEHEKKMRASYKRVPHESYNIDFTNTIHESLDILECIDENYEGGCNVTDNRKLGGGEIILYKKYRCQCYLCEKEYEFLSSDFEIESSSYGRKAKDGYSSVARCDCHKISSFQWRTVKILKEHNINYRVEVPFTELRSTKGYPLKFDFAIYDNSGKLKCLIECQGKQHDEPIYEFGGERQYKIQKMNDDKKRCFANEKNIPLYELRIDECKTTEKEIKFMKNVGII